jgi:hypothetical protein
MRTSCRWNLLTYTSSLLVIVFAAVGVSLSFLPLASLSIYYECCHRCLRPSLLSLSYISCLIAVVVHIAVITLIAAIAISVFLPLLPLYLLYALCTHPPGYTLRITGWCLNEIELPAVGPVEWFPTQLEVRCSFFLPNLSAFGVVVVGAVVGAEFPAVVGEAFSVRGRN